MNIALLANIVFLADLEDVVKVIVALLFVVFWILGQLGDLKKPKKAVQPGRKVPGGDAPPHAPPQGMPDQQAQPDQADPLRRRVEEMLQQATRDPESERRQAEQEARQHEERRRAAAQQSPVHQSPPQKSPPQKRELRPTIELMTDNAPPKGQALPAQPPRSQPSTRQRRPAAGPRAIRERVSHLGEEVALADDKVEARLHAKFDHNLGRLSDTHEEGAYDRTVASNVAANQIAAMLADPQSIRQAILLQEILKRPEDRW